MGIKVKKIINEPIDSNCFVLYLSDEQQCIIVDPGTVDCQELNEFLYQNNLIPIYIILTHEHFDHILGLNYLRRNYDCKVIATELCSEKIKNRKKNLSVFQDQIGFECASADMYIESLPQLNWYQYIIRFLKTPGHTNSSLSFEIDQKLFVGDLIIKGVKTVTKLPSGNKLEAQKSITSLELLYGGSVEIFPGHGDNFLFSEININSIV